MTDLIKFDYGELSTEDREFVKQKETAIKARTAQTIIENGRDLMEVKERLGHGQFMKWVESNFPWSHQTVNNMINVAVKFPTVGNLDVSAKVLYLLSQNSTPDSARTEAIDRAEAGETLTHKEAKELVKAHKRIEERESQIADLEESIRVLRSQLPTEDVTAEITRLKAELKEAQNKPPKIETPEDYGLIKMEKKSLEHQLKANRDDLAELKKAKREAIEKGVADGIERQRRELQYYPAIKLGYSIPI